MDQIYLRAIVTGPFFNKKFDPAKKAGFPVVVVIDSVRISKLYNVTLSGFFTLCRGMLFL
jgi:hypothetical protein